MAPAGRARLATTSATTCSLPDFKRVGGIFYEHTTGWSRRGSGFLTIILRRGFGSKKSAAGFAWLGVLALAAVMPARRAWWVEVTWMKDELGIFMHASRSCLGPGLSIAFFPPAGGQKVRSRPAIQQNTFVAA